MRPGFESRQEHPAFSPASAGSKRDKQADSYKPKNAKSGFDYVQFLNLVKEQSAELNFRQLKELKGTVNHVFSKKYRGNGPPKYGSINKGFTELELQCFLRNVKSEKFKLLFKYHAYLDLRVSDVGGLDVVLVARAEPHAFVIIFLDFEFPVIVSP